MQRRTRLSLALALAISGFAMIGSQALVAGFSDELQARATSGDLVAQRQLGEALLHGTGRERNVEQGLGWLQQAAERDDAVAHYALYNYFRENARTPAERDLRHHHLRRAGALGHTGALTAMAQLYLTRAQDKQLGADDATRARAAGIQLLERAASAGNADAANLLGDYHLRGLHVAMDTAKAITWFEKADDGRAHFRLAELFTNPPTEAIKRDLKRGYHHLHAAANKRYPEALRQLVADYEAGRHLPRNLEIAQRWADFAVASGVRDLVASQQRIAAALQSEAVIAREKEAAAAQAVQIAKADAEEKAKATAAPQPAAALVHREVATPKKVEAAPTPAAIADAGSTPPAPKAAPEARPTFTRWSAHPAAGTGRVSVSGESLAFTTPPSVSDLSARLDQLQQRSDALEMEVRGLRAELDRRDAHAEQLIRERDEALAQVATLERTIASLRGDHAPARHLPASTSAIAASADHEAINRRALAAFERRDYEVALKHFNEAAELGNTSAMNNLAMMHIRGYGVAPSLDIAIAHFERAAAGGSDVAAANLAHLYHYGRGVRVDHQRALAWYKRARELGNPTAQTQIDQLTRHDRGLALASAS